MNRKRIVALIEKYLKGTSSHEENAWVEKWLDSRSEFSDWSWKDDNHKKEIQQEIFDNIDDEIVRTLSKPSKRSIHGYKRTIAAMLIVGLAFGFWFITENKQSIDLDLTKSVVPGTKAASLKMGNGEVIYLDDREEGLLSQLDNVEITKEAGGLIHYNASESISSHRVVENTLFVPRGGQYQITLSDGTRVWLNSETKLIFPTRFVGKERKVKLFGEAYFDVAKNVNQPFIVESGKMEILVTGTEFNVSAYEGASESFTTLVEGSVEVYNKAKENIRLIPGQQAYLSAESMEIQKRHVDLNTIASWKKGYFTFDYQSLEEVMNEISRWYDIDYQIVGKAKRVEKLGGTFSRDKSLDELLNYLEQLVDVKINRIERSVILMH